MEELLIPNPSTHDVVSYQVLIEGQAMNPSYQLLSLCVIKEINRIPTVQMIIRDGDASSRNFEISNSGDLIPGKKIIVKIGFDGTNAQVFKGIITRQSVKIKGNGNTQLIIEAKDEAIKMAVGRKNKYFENIKDSDLFDEIIGTYSGLTSDAKPTSVQHKHLVQHHLTDWDFINLRAEANGMLVNVNDGTIKISRPDTSTEPVLQATYGSSIIELDAEVDARSQWKNVKAVSWDYANQHLFEADTDEASSFAQHGNISGADLANAINLNHYQLHHSGHIAEDELQAWVDGIMLRSRMGKIRGRVRVTGFSGIKPGDLIKLEGIGDRYNGKAYVTAIKHDIGNGSWETHIQFGLDPEGYEIKHRDLNDPMSAGLMGGIRGLQIGIVVHLATDPDGEDRILVRVPMVDNAAQGIWSRVACLDAGNERGTFFRPEIGDEVIVGFINEDPNHAIVLGMLNSSAKKAPLRADDSNHEKGIFTRSKMRIHFNDQTKTITIDTPAKNSIKLDEQGTKIEIKDQNNNEITLDSSGIKMKSPNSIDVEAGTNLTLKAGATLSIGALNLSMKADANIGMEGALAKLSSSGITEISGSLVKIN